MLTWTVLAAGDSSAKGSGHRRYSTRLRLEFVGFAVLDVAVALHNIAAVVVAAAAAAAAVVVLGTYSLLPRDQLLAV